MAINDYKILRDHQCTLQETSKDTTSTPAQYMTTCRKRVVNFDGVKTEFLNQLDVSEESAKSVDAFVMENENYLVEFKNGNAREEQHDIHCKAKDSMLILNSILKRQVEESRETDTFILVYNKDKTKLTDKELRAGALAKKGKTRFTLFGLDKMRGFCFRDVKTLNQEQFEEEIINGLGW